MQVNDESLCAPMEALQGSLADMQHDRRVLFVGGSQCGRSSLLAGLAQLPWLADYSMDGPCVRWRSSCRDGEGDFSRFLDEPDLQGVELVDTAPLEDAAQFEFVSSLLPRTDLLICVLSAQCADHGLTWDFIDSLPEDWAGHCVLAVTHTDLLAAHEALDLKAGLRERCRDFTGHAVSLYFVPALLATRTMEVFAGKMEELLNSSSHGHRAAIRSLSDACDVLLHAQRVVLSARESVQRSDYGFVDRVDRQIDELALSQLRGHEDAVDYYLDIARGVLPSFISSLWGIIRSCAMPSGLLELECLPEGSELYFYRGLARELSCRQSDADRQLMMTCEAHWREVRPLMKRSLGCDIEEFNGGRMSADLRCLRERFIMGIYQVFVRERFRHELSRVLLAELSWVKGSFFSLCLLVIVLGILGALGFSLVAFLLLMVALLAWVCVFLSLYGSARRVRVAVAGLAESLFVELRLQLNRPMREFIIRRVEAYRRMYALPRRRLSEQAASLEPMIKRQSELQRQLRALEPYL